MPGSDMKLSARRSTVIAPARGVAELAGSTQKGCAYPNGVGMAQTLEHDDEL
jgi:hypothetical protein